MTNNNEQEYLQLVNKVLVQGIKRKNRTNVDTLSLFGERLVFDISEYKIPLLTTKKMNFNSIVEELLWFMSGSTNTKILSNKGVNIWNENSSKEYLLSRNLFYEEGDIGPGYGFQWRHCGEKYINMHTNYKGIDQLQNCINMIKRDPYSRRIILSSWIPQDIDKMALPPCHCFIQFYVNNNELSGQMYQRSADIGLGLPYNMASYSLLLHLIAKETNLKATKFIHIIGDSHIYLNHITGLQTQLRRIPFPSPYISINNFTDIFNVKSSDILLHNYKTYGKINLPFVL
jgi:thymidylate synthase